MKWLAANIQFFLGIGLLLLLGSFVRIWFVRPNSKVLRAAIVLLCLAGIGGLQLLNNAPDNGKKIVDEDEADDDRPNVPDSALDRLRLPWDSESAAYWPAAETLAEISEQAYLPPVEAEQAYHSLGFNKVMPFVEGSMIGYVISGEDVTVVVFRGTDFNEVSDWMANLGTGTTETEHGTVHRGFYFAYESMKRQIEDILKDRDTTHLWITGHSLGGALALTCAYDFVSASSHAIDGVITFGQPMIAKQELAAYLDTLLVRKYARFVNRDDIVPRVPPNYEPCGSLVWFTDDGVKRSKVQSVIYGTPVSEGLPPAAPSAPPEEVEIQPLSEQEFRQLQMRLKAENSTVERLPEGTPVPMANNVVAGPVDDHSMWAYLDKVRTLLGLNEMLPPQ